MEIIRVKWLHKYIIAFNEAHQNRINVMMEKIASEFSEPIFTPKSKKIVDVYRLSNNQFWVAIDKDNVIGTIGLVALENKNIALKSMFVDKGYRGKGISKLLLDTIINWAVKNDYEQIYLGTMLQFSSAHRFYEKNGFVKCTRKELPSDFGINILDSIFYIKRLKK